jgi:hypothetical protein
VWVADRVADIAGEETMLGGKRARLVRLLDPTMALPPLETRRVLLEHYLAGSPQGKKALRLALSRGAVATKLQHGRLVLRRLVATEVRQDAPRLGLVDEAVDHWHETRIRCQAFGQRRLIGRLSPTRSEFWLRYPAGCAIRAATIRPRTPKRGPACNADVVEPSAATRGN